jgi:L-rhamnose mutarotase
MPSSSPKRVAQFVHLKPECLEEYKACHAAVWPEVLEQIKDSNIVDCNYNQQDSTNPVLAQIS